MTIDISPGKKSASTNWFVKVLYCRRHRVDFNYQWVHYRAERATTWSTLYIEIDFSNTRVRIYSRRRSSILLRFCRAEYCASPFCHPPAGFQCCNHGDVAFPQGERVKGVGRIYASMERLPLLKLTHVSRVWCINKTAILSHRLCRFSQNNICIITFEYSLISSMTM